MSLPIWLALSLSFNGSLAGSPGQQPADPVQAPTAPAPGVWIGPSYNFGDFDADGLEDVYVVDPLGTDQLFRNLGTGAFEEVTALHGLAEMRGSRMALWWDFDGDRALDLYVASALGPSKLFQNSGLGFFVDVTAVSGLAHDGAELGAHVLNFDGDACSDLHVLTEQGDLLFHNLGGGTFERVALPVLARGATAAVDPDQAPGDPADVDPADEAALAAGLTAAADPTAQRRLVRPYGQDPRASLGVSSAAVPTLSVATTPTTSGTSLLPGANACPYSIHDRASGNCIAASSSPTLGMLHPLSTSLNVSATGKVGMGTTSPSASLHVAGVDGLLATGTFLTGSLPASGAGTRLMWYPNRAALRAGQVTGGQWDTLNIGGNSIALGSDTTAKGFTSIALGDSTTATGTRSTAMGRITTASGGQSTAMGLSTTASGDSSTATGQGTRAESYASTAVGSYNIGGGSPTSWVATDPLLEIGNSQFGTPRSNAMTVLKNGKVGVGTTSPSAELHVAGVDGLLATGTFGLGTLPASGAGARLMWYPAKVAFRAGEVTGGQWNDANIGYYSVAFGHDTTASGDFSTAMGNATTASSGSTAMGSSTVASGTTSTALGFSTTSSGTVSLATGIDTLANSYCSTAMGSYNVGGGSPLSWVATDPLFEIGNGQLFVSPRSNAMTVLKNGSTGIGTTAPDSRLHVHNGSAGSVTAFTNSVLTIENATNNFVSLLSPDANERGFLFGDPLSNVDGAFIYNSPAVPNGLDLRTNGNVTRMVVNSGGNVGVGTTAPEARVHAHANSAGAVTANGFSVIVAENNAPCFVSLLTPDAEERGILFGEVSNNAAGGIVYNNGATPDGLQLRTNGNIVRMVVDSAGKVGIGRFPTANLLEVQGDASKSSAGDWLANSDRRIKREIESIAGALDVIDRVRPVAFRYTGDYLGQHPLEDKVYFNVIAQEFAEVFPDYVKPSGEGDILQVDTYPMQVYAVAALQELHRIVDEKDARIAALEERVAAADVSARANDARIARLESALAALSTARQ